MGILDTFTALGGTDPGVGDVSNDAFQAPAAAVTPAAPMPAPVITPPEAPAPEKHGIAALLSHAGNFLSGMNEEDPNTGSSFLDRLSLLGAHFQDISDGGDRASKIQDRIDQSLENNQKEAAQKQLALMADQLKMSPREKFLFLTDQKKWAEAYAPHFYGEGGAAGYATPDAGLTSAGALPMSPQQKAVADATDKRLQDLEAWRAANLPILKQKADAQSTSAAASAKRADKMKNGAAAGGIGAFDASRFERVK